MTSAFLIHFISLLDQNFDYFSFILPWTMALAVWGKALIVLLNCSQSNSFECPATANVSVNLSAATQYLAKVKIFPFSHFMVPSFGLLDLLPQVKWTCTDLKLRGCAEELQLRSWATLRILTTIHCCYDSSATLIYYHHVLTEVLNTPM